VADTPAPDGIPALDEAVFRCNVEPELARDCSYLGCHGNAGMALRVYASGKLRATEPASLDARITPLTDDEHRANFLSAQAFGFGGVGPDDNWLLRKAMPADAGGYEHEGGAIFTGWDDARAVAIHDWLAGAGQCQGQTP
jgi:hypothetical protein